MAGEHFDAVSDASQQPPQEGDAPRAFVGIHFTCCDVYTRIYIDADRLAYTGNCPRCAKPIHIGVGPGGTSSRFFTAQ